MPVTSAEGKDALLGLPSPSASVLVGHIQTCRYCTNEFKEDNGMMHG